MLIYIFLIVVQALIAATLVGVILMQQSEGGGLGVGGSPAGLMSARGAASFLTRATAILAIAFVVLSITLAAIAAASNSGPKVDTTLQRNGAPTTNVLDAPSAAAPVQTAPASADPVDNAAKQ